MMAHAHAPEPPLHTLRRLCGDGASGELIFVAEDIEVHVYLQSGRVAWATSSRARLVFSKELIAQGDIDHETFRELLDDCRKSRRPLGETLVSWGLASEEQVRSALELQLRDALQTVAGQRAGSTLFLERARAFAHYDRRFTFDGLALLEELDSGGRGTDGTDRATRSDVEPTALCHRVLERVPGALWSCVRSDDGQRLAAVPEERTQTLPALAWKTFDLGVSLAVVRAGRGTAVGFRQATGVEHLWLGLRSEAPLGAALSALTECLGQSPSPRRPSVGRVDGELCSDPAGLCSSCSEALREVLARTPELRALAVCEAGKPTHVERRQSVPVAEGVGAALQHVGLLQLGRSAGFHASADDMESLGFHFASMALSIHEQWHFVSEVTDGSGRLLWLLLDGHASQGLGWALTASANRLLASQSCCSRTETHG